VPDNGRSGRVFPVVRLADAATSSNGNATRRLDVHRHQENGLILLFSGRRREGGSTARSLSILG
jgi:hypothetical protein